MAGWVFILVPQVRRSKASGREGWLTFKPMFTGHSYIRCENEAVNDLVTPSGVLQRFRYVWTASLADKLTGWLRQSPLLFQRLLARRHEPARDPRPFVVLGTSRVAALAFPRH